MLKYYDYCITDFLATPAFAELNEGVNLFDVWGDLHSRESKGLTQQEMADMMHTPRTGYSKMENNQQNIPVDKLVFVAKHFGISVDNIIFFNGKKQYSQRSVYGRYRSSGTAKAHQ